MSLQQVLEIAVALCLSREHLSVTHWAVSSVVNTVQGAARYRTHWLLSQGPAIHLPVCTQPGLLARG